MLCKNIISLYQDKGIPLADIKTVFDGYFHISFDEAFFSDKDIPDSFVLETLDKLLSGYPANYLAGYIDVQGLHLFLNEDTLIPRNETIAFVFDFIKNQYPLHQKKVLDLCTGSGLIALGVKKLFPDAMVYGSDISLSALEMAKKSAKYNHLDVTFLQSDYLNDIQDTFDVILSNPPYIPVNAEGVNAPFEPDIALYSGEDGLDSYRSIFAKLDSHLNKDGFAMFEMDARNCYDVTYSKEGLVSQYKNVFSGEAFKDIYGRYRYLKLSKR